MHLPSKIKRSNAGKLREAARIAMTRPVLLALDVDHVMTLSLAPWQKRERVAQFEGAYVVLGVFRAEPGEEQDTVHERLTEEARHAGALL